MPATSVPPVLPPSWLHVLEKIEASLAETLRRTDESGGAPPEPRPEDAAWRAALARLDDRLAALDDCAGRAGRAAAEADGVLADAADGLRRLGEQVLLRQQRRADQGGEPPLTAAA
jgi:hypothetical protein